MFPEQADSADVGFPIITVGLIVLGLAGLGRFFWGEAQLFRKKKEEYHGEFNNADFISYRLDFYFSKSKWAKPLLLLGVTFFLILFGSMALWIWCGIPLSAPWKEKPLPSPSLPHTLSLSTRLNLGADSRMA